MSKRDPHEIRVLEDRWVTVRHIVEAVAIVSAGIWAFYTFVYQERIKPASEPAALTLTIALSSLGHDRLRDIVNLHVGLHDTGKTEIDIAADGYNIWGERYGGQSVVRRRESPDRYRFDSGLPIVSRRLITAFAELRDAAVGGTKGNHIIIEPGSTETLDRVFAVPHGAYDIIHAQVSAVPIKTTRTAKVPIAVTTPRVGGYLLRPAAGDDAEEDDNTTDFALPP